MLELLLCLFCSLRRALLAMVWSRGVIMCWCHLVWQPHAVLVVLPAPVIVAHLSHHFCYPCFARHREILWIVLCNAVGGTCLLEVHNLLVVFCHLFPCPPLLPFLIPLVAMLVPPGGDPPLSFAGPRHEGRSLVIGEAPGAASQIVLDLCTVAEGPAPYLPRSKPQGLVDSLAECSRALYFKVFEVEFWSAIDVVKSVFFLHMHDSFLRLSKMAPSGLAHLALEPCVHQDIHLGGIVTTFGLVCEVVVPYL